MVALFVALPGMSLFLTGILLTRGVESVVWCRRVLSSVWVALNDRPASSRLLFTVDGRGVMTLHSLAISDECRLGRRREFTSQLS